VRDKSGACEFAARLAAAAIMSQVGVKGLFTTPRQLARMLLDCTVPLIARG